MVQKPPCATIDLMARMIHLHANFKNSGERHRYLSYSHDDSFNPLSDLLNMGHDTYERTMIVSSRIPSDRSRLPTSSFAGRFVETATPCNNNTSQTGAFNGHRIPNEIIMLLLDILPFEDRATLAAVNRQFRCLSLATIDKLKIMKDLPFCSPAPASTSSPLWLFSRAQSPAQNMYKLQRIIVRCSSVLTYLNLLGTNILSQDLMSWIYHIDLPLLENLKFPNGTDLYVCLLRDLANNPGKWPHLNQISIGFGSKLEVPEECLELVRQMRVVRPSLKSNIARCIACLRLYFTDSRVKCQLCGMTICSQHFTRAAGNHCRLSLRIKCHVSGLKYHTTCLEEHGKRGCESLDPRGEHWQCYREPVIKQDISSTDASEASEASQGPDPEDSL